MLQIVDEYIHLSYNESQALIYGIDDYLKEVF